MLDFVAPDAIAALPRHEIETLELIDRAIAERRLAEPPEGGRRHPEARRNLFAYFLGEVMGWGDPEIAQWLGYSSKQAARMARLRGARLTPAGRLDPMASAGSRGRAG